MKLEIIAAMIWAAIWLRVVVLPVFWSIGAGLYREWSEAHGR